MTATAFDFSANQHLYLLKHTDDELFQIRTNSTIATRWRLLSTPYYDLDKSTAIQFNTYSENQDAAILLRKLCAPHKKGSTTDSALWYPTACMPQVLTALQPLNPAAVIPLRVIVPKDPVERADQEEDEKAYHTTRLELEQAEARERARLRDQEWERANAERLRKEAVAREEKQIAEARALEARVNQGVYFSPSNQPPDLLAQLTGLLRRVNVLCNGYCELRHRVKAQEFELNFYVRNQVAGELASVLKQLEAVVVFNQDLNGAADESLRLSYPFSEAQRAYPPSKSRTVSHESVAIDVSLPFVHEMLIGLRPGIRGWDLPAQSAVLGYNPPPDLSTLGSLTPPTACSTRQVWSTGTTCNSRAIHEYLGKFGIKLGWEPASLKFVANSPFPQDAGAPLMLLRLVRGAEAVGIQKIRLDTGAREALPFQGCSVENAVGALWAPAPHVFIVPCLEDAMAMQSQVRKPCIVAPSPTALAELTWPAGLECVTALLPARGPEPWIAALAALKARSDIPHGGINVVQLFPHELSECPGMPFPAEWAWQCTQAKSKAAYAKRK